MRGSDISGLFQFASVININLAVVNILPLPALDGAGLAIRYCSPRHPTQFKPS
jgi:membrane-associated protease RseP (regulator of RpoE activity)